MAAGRPPVSSDQRARARAIQQHLLDVVDARGIGREQLARDAQIDRRTIDNYFAGESPSPQFFFLAALARPLRVKLDDLGELPGVPHDR